MLPREVHADINLHGSCQFTSQIEMFNISMAVRAVGKVGRNFVTRSSLTVSKNWRATFEIATADFGVVSRSCWRVRSERIRLQV